MKCKLLPLSAVSYLNYACSVFCSDQLEWKHSNLKKSTTCRDPLSLSLVKSKKGKGNLASGLSLNLIMAFKRWCPSFSDAFRNNLFSKPHNLGLEGTFWTFSVLKIIVRSMAFCWAQKIMNFNLICACGSCSKRLPVKTFWPILPYLFSNPITLACNVLFWTFSVLKLIVLMGTAILDLGLICA